jgi:hypothetical protein
MVAGSNPAWGARAQASYLRTTVPPGPTALRDAKKALTKLLNQVDEKRAPRTSASVNQLLDRYFEIRTDLAGGTLRDYMSKANKHIRPILGTHPIAKLDTMVLESLYADLRRCRDHCRGQKSVQHRTDRPHVCDEHDDRGLCDPVDKACRACTRMCKPHQCQPLKDSGIRAIHWILSGALDAAVRWGWLGVNPAKQARKPTIRSYRRSDAGLSREDAAAGQPNRPDPHELRAQTDRPRLGPLVSPQLHEEVRVINEVGVADGHDAPPALQEFVDIVDLEGDSAVAHRVGQCAPGGSPKEDAAPVHDVVDRQHLRTVRPVERHPSYGLGGQQLPALLGRQVLEECRLEPSAAALVPVHPSGVRRLGLSVHGRRSRNSEPKAVPCAQLAAMPTERVHRRGSVSPGGWPSDPPPSGPVDASVPPGGRPRRPRPSTETRAIATSDCRTSADRPRDQWFA